MQNTTAAVVQVRQVSLKEILFFASIVLALFFLSLAFRYVNRHKLRLFLISVSTVYLIAAALIILIDCMYYIVFSYRLTFSVVQTVLNTNSEEVKDFVKLYFSLGTIIAVLIFVGFVCLIFYKRSWFIALFATKSFFVTTAVLAALGAIDFAQTAHSKGNGTHNMRYWDIIIGEYNEYNEFNRRLASEKNNHMLSREYDSFYSQDTLQKTLVFVISESLSKRHMSLYGYKRSTTPNLDTNKNLTKFDNCVTQAALTIDAVPALFFNGYLSKKINFISLLNKLDYETTWISNQSGWGKGDKSIVLLAQICGRSFFTDFRSDNDKSNASIHFDEEVLRSFETSLSKPSNKSKFIVLHLMGCHFDYEKRYPPAKNIFVKDAPAKTAVNGEKIKKIINFYDNAMLYHDSVLNEVVKMFTKYTINKNAALVFLSDHGEELYENRDYAGHSYPPTKVMSEIPYFTLLSTEFKKNFPLVEEVMNKRQNTPYCTGNNFYTLIHLLNITSTKHKSKILKAGFFSASYDSTRPRMVMGLDYDKMNY